MRALLIVLNGLGVGGAPDASRYRDEGADTLGHLFERRADLELPALFSLGLGEILKGNVHAASPDAMASYGRMQAASPGKDTTTGHWEIAGVISQEAFATFEKFPDTLVQAIETVANVKFIGNDARQNGTILNDLGGEHLKTGQPILGIAPGSVMQIFAHEQILPPARLHEICRIARRYCNTHRISRVVARPFAGEDGNFAPGPVSQEYSAIPPRTILNAISETGLHVDGIGRVSPIFARSGLTRQHLTQTDGETLRAIEYLWTEQYEGLVFANLRDIGIHGRQRNTDDFAEALLQFDHWLAGFLNEIHPEDLLIITADHGCDPTFPGTGHTREEVPLLVGYGSKAEPLGTRSSFADVAATLSSYFHLRNRWRTGLPIFNFPLPYRLSRRY